MISDKIKSKIAKGTKKSIKNFKKNLIDEYNKQMKGLRSQLKAQKKV